MAQSLASIVKAAFEARRPTLEGLQEKENARQAALAYCKEHILAYAYVIEAISNLPGFEVSYRPRSETEPSFGNYVLIKYGGQSKMFWVDHDRDLVIGGLTQDDRIRDYRHPYQAMRDLVRWVANIAPPQCLPAFAEALAKEPSIAFLTNKDALKAAQEGRRGRASGAGGGPT